MTKEKEVKVEEKDFRFIRNRVTKDDVYDKNGEVNGSEVNRATYDIWLKDQLNGKAEINKDSIDFRIFDQHKILGSDAEFFMAVMTAIAGVINPMFEARIKEVEEFRKKEGAVNEA